MAAVRSKCYFFTEKKPTVQMMPRDFPLCSGNDHVVIQNTSEKDILSLLNYIPLCPLIIIFEVNHVLR